MSEWQPIETAPKDGTWVLAHGRGYGELDPMGRWFTHEMSDPLVPLTLIIRWRETWYDADVDLGNGKFRKEKKLAHEGWDPAGHAFYPEHWMPLPSPPKAST